MLLIAGCATALLLAVPGAMAQAVFAGPDLSASDRLLVSARVTSPSDGPYETLFLADARTRSLRQLTFYPEEALLLRDGEVLQIRNRFGVFRTSAGFAGMAAVAGLASSAPGGGATVAAGAIAPMAASPDGRWLAYVRQRTAAHGDLVLLDAAAGAETVIATGVELSLDEPPALWSPDSRFFLYARGSSSLRRPCAALRGASPRGGPEKSRRRARR
jgi:hypothetical protein